jgi:hypothetical protein
MRTPRSVSGLSRSSPCIRLRSEMRLLGWIVSTSVWHWAVARLSAALIRSPPSSTVMEWVGAVTWALSAMNGSKASVSSIDNRRCAVISRSMGLSRWARATVGGTGRNQPASSGSG